MLFILQKLHNLVSLVQSHYKMILEKVIKKKEKHLKLFKILDIST